MEFAVLGPLRVSTAGRDVTPAPAKVRALLVRLLVDANRLVAAERLVEDLWEGAQPRSASQTLQGYVSQLRKILGAERLVTRGNGYELVVRAGELDADTFEAAVADGRRHLAAGEHARAAERFRSAIDSWRGVALADVAGAEWTLATVSRLDELRLAAIEGVLEADIARGAYTDVVATAEHAIADHPLHERLWAHLMTALYRDGRQADALRAYQALRARLGDELGIEPSPELVELESRMVRQEALQPQPTASGADATSRVTTTTSTLTFMFTDLVTSTRMWEDHRTEMMTALARHDEIIRSAVERHDGRVVKTVGDGTIAVFVDAAAAARAAIAAQQALGAEDWAPIDSFDARIGLHTGPAESRDGDYFGPTLNRAARLTAIAHGGQVIVSRATEAMVGDADDIDLFDLGEHRLRDLTRAERVFQVVVPGQTVDFPPLRSLDLQQTNLPVPLTTFVGRTREIERIGELVRAHRAVTITGVGGVGKTRVALQVAGELVDTFADGAWCSELATAVDEDSMLTIVAATFGAPPRTGTTLAESIVEYVRTKALLWVLDNCEHLLEPVARLVDHVLRAAPDVRVLATSREALDVAGEQVVGLRSMTVAASDRFDAIAESDAVQLFVSRASAARTGFVLDASNAATINTICRRLDGIPLAIELAAVRVVSMSPAEIAALLDQRFRLLTGGRRVALERHQTLRAAVEWSYDLLHPADQKVFERLAVFAGSFEAEAVRAVVTDDEVAAWDAIDAIDGLVRKSLVLAEQQDNGVTRYQMLETLRQYALDRLDEHDDIDTWRDRHAQYYAALGEEIRLGLLGPDEFAWRRRFESALDNLRAAASWALERDDVALAMSLHVGGSRQGLGVWNRMGGLATRALSRLDQLDAAHGALVLMLAAHEAYELGDMRRARELEVQAEAIATSLDVTEMYVSMGEAVGPNFHESTLSARALAALRDDPEVFTRSALGVAQRSRVYSVLATYLCNNRAHNLDLNLARDLSDRALALAQEVNNPSSIAFAYFARALATARDEPDVALDAIERCIELDRSGATMRSGGPHYISSLLLAQRGERTQALSRLRTAIELLAPRGRTPELDGAFGYAIETCACLELFEITAVVLGAVLGGALQSLRDMPVPPDRTTPDVRAIRDTLGRTTFDACVEQGKNMTYDELAAWVTNELAAAERHTTD